MHSHTFETGFIGRLFRVDLKIGRSLHLGGMPRPQRPFFSDNEKHYFGAGIQVSRLASAAIGIQSLVRYPGRLATKRATKNNKPDSGWPNQSKQHCWRQLWWHTEVTHFLWNKLTFEFCSRPRSDGWPRHGRTFSIYLCPLSFWLTLLRIVLSTYWCCPSRPCVVFLACMHLALLLALSLSPGNSLVSS